MRRGREGIQPPACDIPFVPSSIIVWPFSISEKTDAKNISVPGITVDRKCPNRVDADLPVRVEKFKAHAISEPRCPSVRIKAGIGHDCSFQARLSAKESMQAVGCGSLKVTTLSNPTTPQELAHEQHY